MWRLWVLSILPFLLLLETPENFHFKWKRFFPFINVLLVDQKTYVMVQWFAQEDNKMENMWILCKWTVICYGKSGVTLNVFSLLQKISVWSTLPIIISTSWTKNRKHPVCLHNKANKNKPLVLHVLIWH